MISYKARGQVFGNYWGGGRGSYPARILTAPTKEELVNQINKGIKTGGLDSGMGYESLIGAIMEITTIDTREIEGKTFQNEESEIEFFGDLSGKEKEFLEHVFFND